MWFSEVQEGVNQLKEGVNRLKEGVNQRAREIKFSVG